MVIENDSGVHDIYYGETFEIEHMFDDDAVGPDDDLTIWHSEPASYYEVKTLKFTFNEPINFNRLTIKKRRNLKSSSDDESRQNAYNHVCVVLDGDTSSKLCTNTSNGGFNGIPNTDRDLITWTKLGFENKNQDRLLLATDFYKNPC